MLIPLTPLEFKVRAATLFKSKVGLIDDLKRFTYTQLDERSNRLANGIRAMGIEAGSCVAFLCVNSHHVIEAYYGIPQAGQVFTPLNPRMEPENLQQILQESGCSLLFFHASLQETIDTLRPALPDIAHYIIIEAEQKPAWATDYEDLLAQASPTPGLDMLAIDENAPAEIFYIYGGRGGFRGVTLSHRALYLHALSWIMSLDLSDGDIVMPLIPMSDANGWGAPHGVVAGGARLVLLREVNIDSVLYAIHQERVTNLLTVPGFLNALLRHARLDEYDYSSLKHIVISGAAYTDDLIAEAEDRLNCTVEGVYGQVELGPMLTFARPKSHLMQNKETRIATQATGGIPMMGVTMRVVTQEGEDVPWDGATVGEIIVRANTIMLGYHKRPEVTATKLREDGWYYTEDLATINAEGYITITGEKAKR